MLSIVKTNEPEYLEATQQLLWEYGESRNFDAAMGNYKEELRQLGKKYAPPDHLLLLARWNDQPAGCIAYRKIGEGICEMKRLYVSPKFRGKQIGKALIGALIEAAKVAHYTIMRLDSHPWMTTAQGLYAFYGFKEAERYNDNPTPGILFFELKLR